MEMNQYGCLLREYKVFPAKVYRPDAGTAVLK